MQSEFSRVIDALPGLVWTSLPDGSIDYFNQRWREYTGRGLDDAYGVGWQAAIHPEDLPDLLERWRSTLAGKPREMEARVRRFDGEYRWFLFNASPLTEPSGQIGKWCGVITDIDRRKHYRARWWLSKLAREGHFRSIVDGIEALAALVKPTGAVEHVNSHALEYFGATLEELKEWATAGTVHPDDLPAVLAAWKASDETGQPYNVLARRRRADGVYRWFQMRRFPLLDSEGRIYFWYIFETDVDDVKRAEALLGGEKLLLEMVARGDSLPVVLDALCRLVEETASGCLCGVLFFNAAGTAWQHAAGPALPVGYNEAMHGRPAHRASGPCGLAASLKAPVIVSDVVSDTQWDAHGWRTLALAHGLRSCWSSPILSQDQKALGALALYQRGPASPTPFQRDLMAQLTHIASIAVERTRNESALKRSETFLAEAQRLSLTGSFAWHVATDDVSWSEQAHRTYGFENGAPVTLEVIGSRVHPDDLPVLREMIERARGGASDFECEFRLQMPDQFVRYLHLVAHGSCDQDGQLEYVGAIRDVTQHRLSEEALSRARSDLAHVARATSLGALTASIAHEVNQPLSGIITNASTCLRMLLADPPNVHGALETARRTIRDGNRASDVITRLRALFAKKVASTESVDLNEAAQEVIALSRSELQRGRALLRLELDDNLPLVTGDRVQLQQVMLNLLLNASDAMSGINDRPRQLVLRTEPCESGEVRVTVKDAGVGLDPQGIDRLFEAFYTTKSGGMGIGLSVSRSIVDSHHGRLWATPNVGPGATFSFVIPRAPEDPPRAPRAMLVAAKKGAPMSREAW
jgi:PAS domain S-box-containing protein